MDHVMQFVAELSEYEPRIWRRFQISSAAGLEGFCSILMDMFHMTGYHLFDFSIKGAKYTSPDILDDLDDDIVRSTHGVFIRHLFTRKGDWGELWYDFGDSWYVRVKLEILNVDDMVSEVELPRVIKGEGFGIVEDCGGVWGLAEIAERLKTGQGEDWEEQKSWLEEICPDVLENGLDFFDVDGINAIIRARYAATHKKKSKQKGTSKK
ncbi:MAG: plasmid pRiA4b ORF-3 family protein [Candidatus Bathyarchaeota archaeon]|nr:plasmid pRiA4b ORF-3 family protein [Candidatus Termiticorpusculum sp.]